MKKGNAKGVRRFEPQKFGTLKHQTFLRNFQFCSLPLSLSLSLPSLSISVNLFYLSIFLSVCLPVCL